MPPSSPTRRLRDERGFTTIELLVAMVIMAILMVAIFATFRSSKSSTAAKETRTAASVYAQAISQYQADHGNHNPTTWATISGMWGGPKNLVNKPYVKNLPSGVSEGRINVSSTCTGGAGTGLGSVSYCALAEPNFEIRAYTRSSPGAPWPGTPTCYAGRTTSTPRC